MEKRMKLEKRLRVISIALDVVAIVTMTASVVALAFNRVLFKNLWELCGLAVTASLFAEILYLHVKVRRLESDVLVANYIKAVSQ